MARKLFVTDEMRREVMLLTGFRMTPHQIGLLIRHPITKEPLGETAVRELFAHELAAGRAMIDAKVAESLYKKATGSGAQAVTAAIFWAKACMRWDDKTDTADAPPAGVLVVPAMLAPDDWIADQQKRNATKAAPVTARKTK